MEVILRILLLIIYLIAKIIFVCFSWIFKRNKNNENSNPLEDKIVSVEATSVKVNPYSKLGKILRIAKKKWFWVSSIFIGIILGMIFFNPLIILLIIFIAALFWWSDFLDPAILFAELFEDLRTKKNKND
jgi:hypothetical protein